MSQSPTEQEIERLLAQLKTDVPFDREKAAQGLGNLRVKDERVIAALKEMVSNEQYQTVIDAAKTALAMIDPNLVPPDQALHIESQKESKPQKPLTREEKTRDFLIGFAGWFMVNSLIWISPIGLPKAYWDSQLLGGSCIAWMVNGVGLISLLMTRRWAAFGVLTALAVNFAIAVIMNLSLNAVCGIPFFMPYAPR